MCTDTIRATDPKLTPAEEKQLDEEVDTDLGFWKESRNGRSEEMVQGLVDDIN